MNESLAGGKRLVPWFSMEEWKFVREQVYSSDNLLIKTGYQTLLVWKARCPILPVGVECTLEVLRVMLEDHNLFPSDATKNLPDVSSSLELVYSSVIMRFLNFVTELKSSEVSTIYKAANELNIPDWIVNIRHDAAHGRIVPPLPLLQSAVKFIFKWLYENYWQDEPTASQGYTVSEEGERGWKKKLTNVIHYWIQLSQLCQSGVSTLEEMRATQEGKLLYERLDEEQFLKSFQPAQSDFVLLTDVCRKLLRRIQRIIQYRSTKSENDDVIIKILTSEDINMLSCDPLLSNDSLPQQWFDLWSEILETLSGGALLNLLVTLKNIVEENDGSHRAKVAAFWLAELLRIIKEQEGDDFMEEERTWTSKQMPAKEKFQPFLEDCCLHPNPLTLIYLPRVLDLLKPTVKKKKKKLIMDLCKIYCGKKQNVPEEVTVIHSLENLLLSDDSVEKNEGEKAEDEEKEEEEEEEFDMLPELSQNVSYGMWSRAQDDQGWSTCPIGVVPWQRQKTLPDWSKLAALS